MNISLPKTTNSIKSALKSIVTMTMYSFGVYILLAIVAEFVSCRPDGASPVSCSSMVPDHFNPILSDYSESQRGPSPYRFTAAWDGRMKMVRISVRGEKIQGFLIQGRLTKHGPAIGHFVNITENPDATYQDCSLLKKFGATSSVTHSNREYQDKLDFFWEPPTNSNDIGNITFFATLARNKNVFWTWQETNSILLIPDYSTNTPPTPTGDLSGKDPTGKPDFSDKDPTGKPDLSDKDPTTGKPGRASILSSTLSVLMVTFMINLLIH